MRLTGYLNTDICLAHKQEGSADYIRDKNINRNWMGFRIYNPENLNWNYETSYTYEFGEDNNTRIGASGLFLKTDYQFKEFIWQPCLTLRYTYASGNNPETATNKTFDPAYGAGDRYYGWMNIVKWNNLDDREIMVELYSMKGMRLELKYNIFNIPRPEGVKINGNLELLPGKKHLGDEIDLFAKFDYNEHWQFVTVLGYFMLKDVQNANTNSPGNAFWISFQVQYNLHLKLVYQINLSIMKINPAPAIILTTLGIGVIVVILAFQKGIPADRFPDRPGENTSPLGVCPPFYLFTEEGDTIDPVKGTNANKPYSPKQTCGKCHDYDLITEGFHFQQGKGEKPSEIQSERIQWVSTPGNYGGPWCSPAPLYRYLSPKENTNTRTIDMTSFSFITAGCGNCHPGGGSAEYDRLGNRYDRYMLEKGYESGGMNDLDGDYYQAR